MRYIKLYESVKDIHYICKKYNIRDYTINSEDGSIDVNGSVDLIDKGLNKLPDDIKINRVTGYFDCEDNYLTSLEGCPRYVGGNFYCRRNNINSFEGFPKHIGGNFYCGENPIVEIWGLFRDPSKIEFFNDCDIIQDGVVILDRLNFFLEEIGKKPVTKVEGYKYI